MSAGAVTYTYDARNELLSDGTKTYTYTPRGTQSKVTTSAGAAVITYDAFGQAISQGDLGYSYDPLGRMLTARNGATTTTLSYSGAGNTIVNDGTTAYTRDPGDGLLAVKSIAEGAAVSAMVWTDQHDDVVAQFAGTATSLTRSVAYDPWGTVTTAKSLLGNLGFQSGWTDPSSGRVDMLTRWYDPGEGQFTSRDAVGLSPVPASISANRFAYVNDNPLAGTDPTGECSWWDVVCGAKAVAHAASSAYHSATNFVSHSWTAAKHVVHHVAHKIKKAAHHVYHAARKAVHHVVHSVKRFVHHVVHKIRDGYHQVRHYVSHTWHKVKQAASHVYHKVKHAVKRAVHHVSSAIHKTVGAVKHAVHKAAHKIAKAGTWVKHKGASAAKAVKQAAKATGNFLAKHAATITSVVVSVVVFAGCEAVVSVATAGVGSAPGAILCGAIAGAAGSMAGAAVKAHQEGRDVTGAELGQAALTGGIGGALGGAAGPLVGKAISAVGGKLAAPVANTVARTAGSAERSLTSSASAGERTAIRDVAEDAGEFCLRKAHSFTPDTKVVKADGTAIAIARLRAGDKVRSRNVKTGKNTVRTVTRVHINHDSDLLDLIVIENGHRGTLHTTARHPFWSHSRQNWVRADELTTRDRLGSRTGSARVAKVSSLPGDADRWDLTVDADHNYYVTVGSGGVLVHNCGGSQLEEASQAAYRAAESPSSIFIKNKHLASARGNQAKFLSDDVGEIQKMVALGLNSDGVLFLPNQLEGTFRAIVPAGRVIGTRGQSSVRAIVTNDGRVINAFPVRSR